MNDYHDNLSTLSEPVQMEDTADNATKALSHPSTKKEWDCVIKDWEKSGLTQRAFCEAHGIKPYNLSYHRNAQLKKKQRISKNLYPLNSNLNQISVH